MKTGTREWAEVTRNLYTGCSNGCLYCYGRELALRFGWIKDRTDWNKMRLKRIFPTIKKFKGRVMFPSMHDINEENVDACIDFLRSLLELGNEVLIVSKPKYSCIVKMCRKLEDYKDKITFRFTIGSMNDLNLRFWEPKAPSYRMRFISLMWAYRRGFSTSVSCEPYLDDKIDRLVNELLPYITDSIWIGKMNKIRSRVNFEDLAYSYNIDDFDYSVDSVQYVIDNKEVLKDVLEAEIRKIESICSDEFVLKLYEKFKDNPKVKWKDSIKKVINN